MFSQRMQNTNKIKINPNKDGLEEEYEPPCTLLVVLGPIFLSFLFLLKQGKHKGNLQELLSSSLEVWRQLEACKLGITSHLTQRL
jgi:hypothetical protein